MQNKFLPMACVVKCQDPTQDAFNRCVYIAQSLMRHLKWQELRLLA